jgi:hypothetical protein
MYILGCVTRDGEHANEYGVNIIAYQIANVVINWLDDHILNPPFQTRPLVS